MSNSISGSEFKDYQAVRRDLPLLLALVGESGGGKTFSSLELATGIVKQNGGEIFFVDTEANRALHYAEDFKFRHVPFSAPFGPLRYMAAVQYCISRGAGCVIIDSMTHEHTGEGGVLDQIETFLQEKCGNDFNKRKKMTWASQIKPKAERQKLTNYLLQASKDCPIILCYRGKDKLDFKHMDENGPKNLGVQAQTTSPLIWETVQQFLLRAGCDGVPVLLGETPQERALIKSPHMFRGWFQNGQRLNAEIGERFAKWQNKAGTTPQAPPSYRDDADAVIAAIEQSDTLEAVKAAYSAFYKMRDQYSATDCAAIAAAKDAAKTRLES